MLAVGDGEPEGAALEATDAAADGDPSGRDTWPAIAPISQPTSAARARTATRTDRRPILATERCVVTDSYLVLKYASITGVPVMVNDIAVEPSTVWMTT